MTHTPSGQELTVGIEMSITPGWYQSSRGFFEFLVDQGLPETKPVSATSKVARQSASEHVKVSQDRLSAGAMIVILLLVGAACLAVLQSVRNRSAQAP